MDKVNEKQYIVKAIDMDENKILFRHEGVWKSERTGSLKMDREAAEKLIEKFTWANKKSTDNGKLEFFVEAADEKDMDSTIDHSTLFANSYGYEGVEYETQYFATKDGRFFARYFEDGKEKGGGEITPQDYEDARIAHMEEEAEWSWADRVSW